MYNVKVPQQLFGVCSLGVVKLIGRWRQIPIHLGASWKCMRTCSKDDLAFRAPCTEQDAPFGQCRLGAHVPESPVSSHLIPAESCRRCSLDRINTTSLLSPSEKNLSPVVYARLGETSESVEPSRSNLWRRRFSSSFSLRSSATARRSSSTATTKEGAHEVSEDVCSSCIGRLDSKVHLSQDGRGFFDLWLSQPGDLPLVSLEQRDPTLFPRVHSLS